MLSPIWSGFQPGPENDLLCKTSPTIRLFEQIDCEARFLCRQNWSELEKLGGVGREHEPHCIFRLFQQRIQTLKL